MRAKKINESILKGKSNDEVIQALNNLNLDSNDLLIKTVGLGILDGVKKALNNGVSVKAKNFALQWAVVYNQLKVIKLLLDKGADIHTDDNYALRLAAERGYLEVVKLLLRSGADVHANNDYALRYAAYNGHLDVVKLLLRNGADVHASNDLALRNAHHLEVVDYLQKYINKRK